MGNPDSGALGLRLHASIHGSRFELEVYLEPLERIGTIHAFFVRCFALYIFLVLVVKR
jgi:hypothetical protein